MSEEGMEALWQPHPHLALCIASIWLFLSCTPYNKTLQQNVTVSTVFSRILQVILAKYLGGGRGMELSPELGSANNSIVGVRDELNCSKPS